MYLKEIKIKGKELQFPVYFPDATRGVVKSLDSLDLQIAGIEGVVVNTYHLMSRPGMEVLRKIGGVKKFMGFNGFVTSDSGGFQLLSLIYRQGKNGKVTNEGIYFNNDKIIFTPEKSIQTQFDIGADIMICLDDFTPPDADAEQISLSIRRTTEWAKRCKNEFEKQISLRKIKKNNRPLLFSVVQGGEDAKARSQSAEELTKIGFDGYGFGGWPSRKTLSMAADLLPNDKPKFALGVGKLEDIIAGVSMGYQIFDCVLPTRDARHRRLYIFNEKTRVTDYLYINKTKYASDKKPIDGKCDCFACQNYSRAYLHHLFAIEDGLSWRLSSIHNLRSYTRLIEGLRKS